MKKLAVIVLALFSQVVCAESVDSVKSLHEAVRAGNLNRVKSILKTSSADINGLLGGKTSLDVATERGHKNVARYLLKRGGRVTLYENAEWLRTILKKRAIGFFVGGILFLWPLLFGGLFALNDSASIMVMTK